MKITFLVSGSIRSNFSYRPLALAKSLQKLGHEVSIIAPKADKYNDFIPEEIHEISGVNILQPFQFSTKRLEINLFPYLFGALLKIFTEKADLIYIYKPTPISIVGLISKLFSQTTVISDFDDLGSEVMRIEGHPTYLRKLVEWSEKLAVKYSDRVVVASSFLLEKYSKEFPRKPMLVIPNGVETDWLDSPIKTDKEKRVVFFGSINRENILNPLFDALPEVTQKHPDLEVLIIGDGKFLSNFKEKSERLGISKNIIFTGWQSIKDAKPRLRMGDIGYNYMPDEVTTRAASNMKVPQYMSRGVVPLVSNVGDLSKTIGNGTAGYISKPDPISLKETLLVALDDSDRMLKAKESISLATANLCWDNLAMTFDNWIDQKTNKDKGLGKQKIYFVETSVPGNLGGGEIRNFNLLKQVAKNTDAHIELFCIASEHTDVSIDNMDTDLNITSHIVPNEKKTLLTTLRAVFLERVPPYMSNYRASGLGKIFRKRCEEELPDIVHIEQIHAYYCIRPHIAWLKSNGVKIILDCHNVEFQLFDETMEAFSLPQKTVGHFLVPNIKKLETEATKTADTVLACSEKDAEFFRTLNSETYIIPNGVDCFEYIMERKNITPTLIFMGGVAYPPNATAMEFYISKVHPKILEKIPEAELLAIGVDSNWLASKGISHPSIKPLGFVPDVKTYLAQAAVGICPILQGSGTRIKILTYMAAGLPVVSTHKGAEGVGYTHRENIFLSDDAESFAASCIKLLNDKSFAANIAENGRSFVLKNYDWNVIGKGLVPLYSLL